MNILRGHYSAYYRPLLSADLLHSISGMSKVMTQELKKIIGHLSQ